MKLKLNLLIIAKILFLFHISESKHILGLFPHPGYSHFKVFYPVLQELAKKGHTLTVVTYVKSNNILPNYRELLLKGEDTTHVFSIEMFNPDRSLKTMFLEGYALAKEGERACEVFYQSGFVDEIKKINLTNPFDLAITENFNTDCYLGIPYILNVPVVGLSSCAIMPWYYQRFGLPDTPSFIPSEFVSFNEKMSFSERFINFLVIKGTTLFYWYFSQRRDNQIIKKYLNISIDVTEFAKEQRLMLVNQHYSLSGARPLPPKVVEVGGIHIEENDEKDQIPKEIEQFLMKSKNRVMFISWGSMMRMSSLEKRTLDAIVKALEKQSYDIIWKWESDDIPIKSNKFIFTKWAPQKQLLCHPKVNFFWSHGGLLGVSESVYCGKPLIVTPLYGDQFLNGKAVENRKMGLVIYYNDLTQQNLEQVLKRISEKEYEINTQNVSKVYRNRQNSPLQTAVWWIEQVLENGNHLAYMPSVEMNGFIYHSIDVISVLFVIGLFLTVLPFVIFKKCVWNPKHTLQKRKKEKTK